MKVPCEWCNGRRTPVAVTSPVLPGDPEPDHGHHAEPLLDLLVDVILEQSPDSPRRIKAEVGWARTVALLMVLCPAKVFAQLDVGSMSASARKTGQSKVALHRAIEKVDVTVKDWTSAHSRCHANGKESF